VSSASSSTTACASCPIITSASRRANRTPPAIAAIGDRWFIAFRGINSLAGVYLTRVEADGTILDPTPIPVHPASGASGVGIASGPSGVLLSWRDSRFAIPAIQAARVSADGTVLDPGGFTVMGREAFNVPTPPEWDGMRWPIAWADDSETIHVDYAEAGTASPGPVVVANRLSGPSIASDAAGTTIISYTRWVEVPDRQERLFVRVLTEGGLIDGTPCAGGSACSSGFCADGVCCDTACGATATDDCQVCAVAAGAPRDGDCTILTTSSTCRAALGVCDLAEHCDGVDPLCPADVVMPDGADCDDATACNGAEACTGGVCASGAPPMCEDGDACTTDACIEPTGCAHTAIADCCGTNAECEDGDVCTADLCTASQCQHAAIAGCCRADDACDDSDPCTADRCEDNACVHDTTCCTADTECDDGDECTADACTGGACDHEARADCCAADPDCDDSDACTIDVCDGDGACIHEPSPECETPPGCGCRAAPARPPWLITIALTLSCLLRRRRRHADDWNT
jgi:hypothetical protein